VRLKIGPDSRQKQWSGRTPRRWYVIWSDPFPRSGLTSPVEKHRLWDLPLEVATLWNSRPPACTAASRDVDMFHLASLRSYPHRGLRSTLFLWLLKNTLTSPISWAHSTRERKSLGLQDDLCPFVAPLTSGIQSFDNFHTTTPLQGRHFCNFQAFSQVKGPTAQTVTVHLGIAHVGPNSQIYF